MEKLMFIVNFINDFLTDIRCEENARELFRELDEIINGIRDNLENEVFQGLTTLKDGRHPLYIELSDLISSVLFKKQNKSTDGYICGDEAKGKQIEKKRLLSESFECERYKTKKVFQEYAIELENYSDNFEYQCKRLAKIVENYPQKVDNENDFSKQICEIWEMKIFIQSNEEKIFNSSASPRKKNEDTEKLNVFDKIKELQLANIILNLCKLVDRTFIVLQHLEKKCDILLEFSEISEESQAFSTQQTTKECHYSNQDQSFPSFCKEKILESRINCDEKLDYQLEKQEQFESVIHCSSIPNKLPSNFSVDDLRGIFEKCRTIDTARTEEIRRTSIEMNQLLHPLAPIQALEVPTHRHREKGLKISKSHPNESCIEDEELANKKNGCRMCSLI